VWGYAEGGGGGERVGDGGKWVEFGCESGEGVKDRGVEVGSVV